MINYLKLFRFSSTQFDPYKILGISPNASINEIKQAYHQMSKKFHPDLNNSNDAKDRFAEIHQAYQILKKKKFYDQVEDDFKKNYYSSQSEEECFRTIFGFYFYENPQEYYKAENAQKRADYQDLLKKYKNVSKQNTTQTNQYDIKINRTIDPNSIYRNSDHTMLKVLLLFTFASSITSAYVFFYKKEVSFAKNTLTDSQILRMKTLALIRQQKIQQKQ